ncbi:cytidine deaminase [Ferrimonas balearica]|uniref:cytidine deaminase n=1 Tax=Ferrimonas balearica TaxID=44012 RepID=UPI001C99B71A|nr:cytidine deaminase [Ferrimonas balearica]MBY5920140.1 cytidine deaminase [Ferrimonas balearica]MBY5997175.1 cytidine deaminase [Ferrimonas balearica]
MNSEEIELYQAAVDLINTRYPSGWGGAAAVRTETGKVLTSIAPDTMNDALSLCMEVGAYLEAHKLNEKVTHSLCIYRADENSEFLVLSPCGICQERLVHWGGDVKAAISTNSNELVFKTIRELMPHHWSLVNGNVM